MEAKFTRLGQKMQLKSTRSCITKKINSYIFDIKKLVFPVSAKADKLLAINAAGRREKVA